jgi:hypothetical protein
MPPAYYIPIVRLEFEKQSANPGESLDFITNSNGLGLHSMIATGLSRLELHTRNILFK